ncbi:hypothetical protein FOMPIDRAFT_1049995 [Fomitopsis schrenkii]|uniref:Uncharacterized protein n=1 Tax=Fomitopsis schrenkii TaxID=2126942 RepID=S8EA40_FOMSC|nr:hypothetical protein FOMPIDRAFT_1049995 [Fomitopsis schrenkii]
MSLPLHIHSNPLTGTLALPLTPNSAPSSIYRLPTFEDGCGGMWAFPSDNNAGPSAASDSCWTGSGTLELYQPSLNPAINWRDPGWAQNTSVAPLPNFMNSSVYHTGLPIPMAYASVSPAPSVRPAYMGPSTPTVPTPASEIAPMLLKPTLQGGPVRAVGKRREALGPPYVRKQRRAAQGDSPQLPTPALSPSGTTSSAVSLPVTPVPDSRYMSLPTTDEIPYLPIKHTRSRNRQYDLTEEEIQTILRSTPRRKHTTCPKCGTHMLVIDLDRHLRTHDAPTSPHCGPVWTTTARRRAQRTPYESERRQVASDALASPPGLTPTSSHPASTPNPASFPATSIIPHPAQSVLFEIISSLLVKHTKPRNTRLDVS